VRRGDAGAMQRIGESPATDDVRRPARRLDGSGRSWCLEEER
jgi:hypothetical protein